MLHKLLNFARGSTDAEAYYSNHDKFGLAFVINMENRSQRMEKARSTLTRMKIKHQRFDAINGKAIYNNSIYTNNANISDVHPEDSYSKDIKPLTWHECFPKLNASELGCLLSHLSVLMLAATNPNQDNFTLIFEDDIISGSDGINNILTDIKELDSSGKRVDIVYLGKCNETCSKLIPVFKHDFLVNDIIKKNNRAKYDNLYVAVAPSCAHAICIRNSFARRLIDDIILTIDYRHKVSSNFNKKVNMHEHDYNCPIDDIYRKYILKNSNRTNSKETNSSNDDYKNGVLALVVHPAIFYQDVFESKSDLRLIDAGNYLECRESTVLHNKAYIKTITIICVAFALIILIAIIIIVFTYKKNNRKQKVL